MTYGFRGKRAEILSWWTGTAASCRHGGRSKKQRDHTSATSRKQRDQIGNKVRFYNLWGDKFPPARLQSLNFPKWGYQLGTKYSNANPMGDISHSNTFLL